MLVFVRIDDRLIHGQVVEGWVNYLKATCILVADDKVAANALQRSIMEISVPHGLKVFIGAVADISEQVRSATLSAERMILLFSEPFDALRALKAGLPCPALNIGGMHYVPGSANCSMFSPLMRGDLKALQEIAAMGVKVIDVQTVPTERPLPLEKVFKICLRAADRGQ